MRFYALLPTGTIADAIIDVPIRAEARRQEQEEIKENKAAAIMIDEGWKSPGEPAGTAHAGGCLDNPQNLSDGP